MILYGAVALSALGAAVLVRRHDMYDREPWWMLLACAALGAVLMPACGRLEDLAIFAPTGTPSPAWIAAVASVVEESARAAAVLAVALLLPRLFNDPMDGITYGAMAGIGMAVYESTSYLGPDPPLAGSFGAPELARLYSHLVLGGIAGFPFGLWRTGTRGAGLAFALCGPGVAGLHFVVDWSALSLAVGTGPAEAGPLLAAGAVLAATLAYGGLAGFAAERSRRRFAPCSLRTLFGWPLDLLARKPEIPDGCPPPEE